uniref:Uncharacterized protein n=1 Tax=Romanomermis culicivorax TaxID=13658 RepID=A0A915J7H8_ROMCU
MLLLLMTKYLANVVLFLSDDNSKDEADDFRNCCWPHSCRSPTSFAFAFIVLKAKDTHTFSSTQNNFERLELYHIRADIHSSNKIPWRKIEKDFQTNRNCSSQKSA